MTLLWLLAMDEKVKFEVQWVRPLNLHTKHILQPRVGHEYRPVKVGYIIPKETGEQVHV